MDNPCPFPGLERYWAKRDLFFPGFGDQARFDQESLFSAKTWQQNESFLDFIEQHVGARPLRILDACCGAGSFAITAAVRGHHVYSTDIDQNRLDMAAHNARLFGVEGLIEFKFSDAFYSHPEFLPRFIEKNYHAVYFDPPWGTAGYSGGREKPRSNTAFTLDNLSDAARYGLGLFMTSRMPLFITLPRGATPDVLPSSAEHVFSDEAGPVFRTFLVRRRDIINECAERFAGRIAEVAGPAWPSLKQRLDRLGVNFELMIGPEY